LKVGFKGKPIPVSRGNKKTLKQIT